MSCDEELDFSLLAQDTARFRRRVVELSPGEDRPSTLGSWRDAIAFVEEGEVELECAPVSAGALPGAVLCSASGAPSPQSRR
jgi:hypothetical protein